MRILIVEDDVSQAELFEQELVRLISSVEIYRVTCREDAEQILGTKSFDLAIVDLSIPTRRDGLDQSTSHGLYVLSILEERHRGCIRIAHTALGEQRLIDPLYERASRENIFGFSDETMFMHRPKGDQRGFDAVVKIATSRARLKSIAINDPEFSHDLDEVDKYLIRCFSAARGATTVSGSVLRGGKSGARSYRLSLFDDRSGLIQSVAAKCDYYDKVATEFAKFEKFILNQIKNGTYAQVINREPQVSRDQAAIFYGLASPQSVELLDVIQSNASNAAGVVRALRDSQALWIQNKFHRKTLVRDIRRLLISDEKLTKIRSKILVDVERIESIQTAILFANQHGDFHAGNVLVGPTNEPLIIDFANAGVYPVCLDPLTLELALTFNSGINPRWPSSPDGWHMTERYFSNCPYRDVLIECRKWALSVSESVGPMMLYASAYSYLVRQMQYPDVDAELCNHFLAAIAVGIAEI